MKIRALLVAMCVATVLTGCQNMDSNGLLSSGAEAFQAYSLSDAQVKALSDQACQEMDSKATIAPANSEYAKRLTTIANALGNNINGQPVNYKVYMAKDVNAFAMANGCIRVYSGLMDMMTDNEVEAVIGHEMGHVALGHVKKGMQVALGTNAVRVAAASAGGIVGSLSQSQLGDLGEKLVNSQFSQRQEAEADDYSYDLLYANAASARQVLPPALKNWRNWKKAAKTQCLTTIRHPPNAPSIFAMYERGWG